MEAITGLNPREFIHRIEVFNVIPSVRFFIEVILRNDEICKPGAACKCSGVYVEATHPEKVTISNELHHSKVKKIYGFKVIVEAYRFERLTVHIRRLPQDS